MRARVKNLQPWLDYFRMLQEYEKDGFLQMEAEKHEAYVTRAAFYTAAGWPDDPEALADRSTSAMLQRMRGVASAVRSIRTYAAWLSREGRGYLTRPFSLHVVKEDMPHDLLSTVVVTSRRRWWKLWMWHDTMEVFGYE